MSRETQQGYIKVASFVFLGVMLRYWVMTFGYNYDFESYCIVGDIAGHFQNVYAQTDRYNYGPIFFCIQGFLYRLSYLFSGDPMQTYRVLMVSVLTFADLGIAYFVAVKKNVNYAILFFLNPLSIIITGFHNQFENLAIILVLCSLPFYNEDEAIGKKDWLFVLFLSLSLMMKHIMFLIPVFILFKKNLPLKKKMIYAIVPPAVFLVSFLPFALSSKAAFDNILNNVFLYRSFNNSPLLYKIYELIHFPIRLRFYVYILLMCMTGLVVRKRDFSDCVMIYLIAMVAFSSAITNQALIIPMAALCVLNLDVWNYIYIIVMTVFMIFNQFGFNQLPILQERFPQSLGAVFTVYDSYGYMIAAWILFLALLYELRKELKHGN